MLNTPCKDCEERTVDCHTTCKKYKDYVVYVEEGRKARRADNEARFRHPERPAERFRWG